MIIDFHAHILPRTDHGCDSSAMARQQLRMIKKAGTDAVVATPHFYPNEDHIDAFLDNRDGAVAAMRRKLPMDELPLVYPAAEVLVCAGLHKMQGLEKLTVMGTNVILLEMPFFRWNDDLINTVLGVRERGLCPVLAHIDRYDFDMVELLLKEGISAQVNAEAYGVFKNPKLYTNLMKEGRVVALGSDLHGAKSAGYARFVRMRRRLGAVADTVFEATEALLAGATPILPKPTEQYAY
ncbi:MAG: hypothetical protein IJW51_05700 [Clostridia bacterium]|nr:hypothetical protein [Clostridia bacterium]